MFIIALGYLSEVTDHVPAVANKGKLAAISRILQGLSVIDEEGLLVKSSLLDILGTVIYLSIICCKAIQIVMYVR